MPRLTVSLPRPSSKYYALFVVDRGLSGLAKAFQHDEFAVCDSTGQKSDILDDREDKTSAFPTVKSARNDHKVPKLHDFKKAVLSKIPTDTVTSSRLDGNTVPTTKSDSANGVNINPMSDEDAFHEPTSNETRVTEPLGSDVGIIKTESNEEESTGDPVNLHDGNQAPDASPGDDAEPIVDQAAESMGKKEPTETQESTETKEPIETKEPPERKESTETDQSAETKKSKRALKRARQAQQKALAKSVASTTSEPEVAGSERSAPAPSSRAPRTSRYSTRSSAQSAPRPSATLSTSQSRAHLRRQEILASTADTAVFHGGGVAVLPPGRNGQLHLGGTGEMNINEAAWEANAGDREGFLRRILQAVEEGDLNRFA